MRRVSEHPHERIARELWRAVSRGDVEDIEQLFREDLLWHASGRGPRAGTFEGRDEVLDYLAGLGEDTERFDSTLEDVLVGSDYTALVFRVAGQRGDQQIETGFVMLLRIAANQVAEVWMVPRDQHAIDEFWSG